MLYMYFIYTSWIVHEKCLRILGQMRREDEGQNDRKWIYLRKGFHSFFICETSES